MYKMSNIRLIESNQSPSSTHKIITMSQITTNQKTDSEHNYTPSSGGNFLKIIFIKIMRNFAKSLSEIFRVKILKTNLKK